MRSVYQVYEECLGLVQLSDTKAATIFGLLKDVLIRCSLSLGQCRGQAFDGAANMSDVRCGSTSISKERRESCIICSLLGT